jgi:hypothetical protein
MATNKKANLAAKKAKKQKMILAVCGVLFVIVLVIQGPRILKMVQGGEESTAAPYKAFPDEVLHAGTAQISASPSGKTVLPDRDPQPQASEGQLVDFELFSSKDPFVQQVTIPENREARSDSDSADTGEPDAGAVVGDEYQPDQGQQEEAAPTSATIAVNGTAETVQVGGEFPAADPAFVLVSATGSSVRIGIAGGSLATGDDTVTLRRGKTLTLVNTVDGTEYRLRLASAS